MAARATPYLQALADRDHPDLPSTAQGGGRTRVTDGLGVVLDPDGTVRYSEPASAAAAVMGVLPAADGSTPELVDRTVDGEGLRLRVDRVARVDGTWTVVVGVGVETTDAAAEKVRDALEVGAPVLLLVILAGRHRTHLTRRQRAGAGDRGRDHGRARWSGPRRQQCLRARRMREPDPEGDGRTG